MGRKCYGSMLVSKTKGRWVQLPGSPPFNMSKQKFRIPINPPENKLELYNKSGGLIAIGYKRIVIGKRGPYIELDFNQLIWDNVNMPKDEEWRVNSLVAYYIEFRTNEDNIKIYLQQKTVSYADYRINMIYISPSDLYLKNGERVLV